MKIDGIKLGNSNLTLKVPTVKTGGSDVGQASRKTIGETPPIRLDPSQIGKMASLFAASGVLRRLQRKLNHLKRKKCNVVPAKGTTACIDDKDIVYVGVEFLEAYHNDEETLAGVLAHEWGHSCALKPESDELQDMTWPEIFELRRAHETLADEISGRLLFMMGYKPDGLIKFLKNHDTHNLKYHPADIRAQVILYGFEAEKRKAALAKSLFGGSSYKTEYHSILLDIV